ncbi:hypothetical protein [Acinetobacter higginsii]|uniref:hypothetical protein n=1 Tax=Acinetobacter higginsii TaxID=70347 RepID=UPI001F6204F8|nr:hypothetical protein [Acinetobacter higginsii]
MQSAAGVYSVQGAADAVGEKADPVEMALEGMLGMIMAAPEVAIVSAGKVKNQRTAEFALEQLRQDQQQDAVRSSTLAAILNTLVNRNRESKTNQRDESASQDFLRQAIEEHGAIDEVFIDGQTFNQLLRDRDIAPEDLFSRAPSLQNQLGNAQEFDGTVQIPIDEFVSSMSALDDATDFVENVRSRPDMPTLKEAQENLAKTTEQMRQEAETYLDEQAKFEVAEDSREIVATEIQNQLGKTGTFNAKYNRAAGELASAFYSTLGDKLGISAKEAFDLHPIRIVDTPNTEAGVTFKQADIPEQSESLDSFVKSMKTKHGIELGLKGNGSVISLHKILVPESQRNQGVGTKAMQDIIQYADATNRTIALTPSSDFGSNKNRLTNFYKRQGFVENKGRNKDYEISETMYRAPMGRRFNQANGGVRGSITFSSGQDGSTIVLSKDADFSTFVHELGHHFLEMNMDIAMRPDAPAQVREDMETVLKWAKADFKDIGEWDFFTDAEKTEVHEKFAETFEQYVFTGKAPSIDLKQVFNRFRQFMIAVYRNVEKFLGINDRAELNSDITGVMDRMLASESAIKEAQAAANLEMLIQQDDAMRMLAAEMAALNGLMGRKSALNEAAKAVARDMVQRQRIRDIRPHMRAQDDARLGRMANDAFKKGETVDAARHKRNQLVQFYATKYSYDAKEQVQQSLNLVKKVFGNNEKLAKSRDFDMVTAARGILGKYGLGRDSSNYEQQLELIRKYDPTTYAEIQNIGVLPENQDFKNLTLEQFSAVIAAVETLWHRSRDNKIWHTTNEAFEREQVREELIQQSSGKKSVEKIQQTMLGRDKVAELKARFIELGASAKRVDQVVTWLDGGPTGKYREYILNPMQDALSKYRIEKAKMLDQVVKTFEDFGKLDNSKIAAPELNNYTFIGKQSLLHAIMHTGNTSNKERLVLGYGWGSRLEDGSVDFNGWDQFFNRMIAEGTITKTDMDTIQKFWDLFDSYKEKAQITHKKINGRYFDELPNSPVMTPFGEYKGGYVPAVYDRLRSNEQDRIQDKNLAENNLQALDIATTGANFTKSRVDRYHDQLELDLSRLPSHLDKELRYIHLEQQVRQVGRLLLNKDFRNEIERVLPFGVKQIFNPWLKAVANQSVDESSGSHVLDRVFSVLRRNTGIAIMSANLKNAVEQLTGFAQVTVAVPPKQLLKAQADYFRSIASRQDMASDIMDMSDFMKTRWDRAADEYRYAIDEILFQKNAYQTVKDFTMKHAYFLQTTIQRPMEIVTWQAAFNNFTEKGMNQYDAVHAADSVVRQYMMDMSPEGISNIERGTPAKRMFLMFYNWFNMVWNTANSEAKLALEASNGSWVNASPRLAYVALMMISIPAMVSQLLFILFAGGIKDYDNEDDKWGDLAEQMALSQVKMLTAFVPYAGNVANAAISNTDGNVMNDRYTASPVFSIGESGLALIQHAKRVLDDEKEINQGKAARDLLNTMTFVSGIPFSIMGKPTGYWLDIFSGKKDEPKDAVDAVRGTISGKHAPQD